MTKLSSSQAALVLLTVAFVGSSSAQTSSSGVVIKRAKNDAAYAIYAPKPEYPLVAKSRRIEGNGVFLVHILPDGKVQSVEVLQSTGHAELDESATAAFAKWRFRPGPTKAKIPVSFLLQHVEQRRDARYSYSDWRKLPPGRLYDVPPIPEGGMHAFVSQLSYPVELKRQHIQGIVLMRVSIDAKGLIREVKVFQSASSRLDQIVVDAVRRTRWTPATKHGVPVAATFFFPVTFRTR